MAAALTTRIHPVRRWNSDAKHKLALAQHTRMHPRPSYCRQRSMLQHLQSTQSELDLAHIWDPGTPSQLHPQPKHRRSTQLQQQ